MKVVFLTRTLPFGGAERQLVALAKGLRARGHEVAVAVFYAGGPLEHDLRAAGIRVIDLAKGGRWDMLPFLIRAGRRLRAERADVVHGYLPCPNALSTLLRPVHRARSVWGVRASSMPLSRLPWTARIDGWLERGLAGRADSIIANSFAGQCDVLAVGFPIDRTVVVPNGVDLDRFAPDLDGRARVRAEIGLGEGEVLIGRAGRIGPQKDYETFLDAAAIVAAVRPRVRFVCAGDGTADHLTALRDRQAGLELGDRVAWLGGRTDMAAVYSACELTVSSSAFGEGTPNAVIESLACGVPCVATDVGDSRLALGAHGRLVPSRDAAALAAAMTAMVDSLAAVDPPALREHVARSFSLEALIERTERVLLGVLGEDVARGAVSVRAAT